MLSAIICCGSLVFSDVPQYVSQNRMRILRRAWGLRRSPHVTKAEAVEKATILNSERKKPSSSSEKIQPGKHWTISHINLQHFSCLQATPNSLISKWFVQSQYENCYKRCLKVIMWKKVNRFEKQAFFQEKKGNMKEGARILLERRGAGVAARMCFIGLKWNGREEKLGLCTRYVAVKSRTYIKGLKFSANKILLLW